ncbi:NifU family protein [Vermiphilus pyriformis]|jgi:Fe-S cluster biogenesis protein NfuA|uniref:NIF system FeS cluster assembly NifU C-terminal domain-containing protein n=1 Tax=candidate division TM6 bacterium JCVI TM6SC1 TaxID=1306947 RepID=A0A0D2K514_9BACT|nr:hypothetical protein J120_03340 [candidate division TM6 bacterium JCVI TM6SC1]UNE35392.1 MAG: NifU family protein [Vermiphilus pyriformis]
MNNGPELVERMQKVLDTLRPLIQADGGDMTVVNVENNVVYVKLHGACVGCPMSTYTLKLGVEEALREHFPFIQEVVALEGD